MEGIGMKDTFKKKIYTPWLFLKDMGFLFTRILHFIAAGRNPELTTVLVEKIMAVTSAVNCCVYCSWYHAKLAVAAGISDDEVKNILNLQFHADASDFELMALLYAQHYAETDRRPEKEMTDRLFETYGEKTAKHILLFIRMINFGNLAGNTWDSVISRFKGKPAPGSNILFELVFFLLTLWVMFPVMWLMKRDQNHQAT
jgi:AhpD family alkylhydroperoxidase